MSSTKLSSVSRVYATPTGLKFGSSKSRVQHPAIVLAQLDKGSRRRARKELRKMGFGSHAHKSIESHANRDLNLLMLDRG